MAVLRPVAAVIVASLAACDFVPPPTAVELEGAAVVVHSVIAAGSDTVRVLLTRVTPDAGWSVGGNDFQQGVHPVSSADVRLITPEGPVSLTEEADVPVDCFGNLGESSGPGCYVAEVPGGIRGGVSYGLQVVLPDGSTISGVATPPAPVDIHEPAPYTRYEVAWMRSDTTRGPAEVTVRIDAAPRVAGISVSLLLAEAFVDGAADPTLMCSIDARPYPREMAVASEVPVEIHAMRCVLREEAELRPVQPDSMHVRLLVAAYDSAFMRYRRLLYEKQVPAGDATEGVSGALGLFAGAATAERVITLVPRD